MDIKEFSNIVETVLKNLDKAKEKAIDVVEELEAKAKRKAKIQAIKESNKRRAKYSRSKYNNKRR